MFTYRLLHMELFPHEKKDKKKFDSKLICDKIEGVTGR